MHYAEIAELLQEILGSTEMQEALELPNSQFFSALSRSLHSENEAVRRTVAALIRNRLTPSTLQLWPFAAKFLTADLKSASPSLPLNEEELKLLQAATQDIARTELLINALNEFPRSIWRLLANLDQPGISDLLGSLWDRPQGREAIRRSLLEISDILEQQVFDPESGDPVFLDAVATAQVLLLKPDWTARFQRESRAISANFSRVRRLSPRMNSDLGEAWRQKTNSTLPLENPPVRSLSQRWRKSDIHFSNIAFMKHNTTHDLNVEWI
jgi:hypothetical protein